MTVYRQPLYYEIAFSFIDAKKQVDCFEEIISKFSEIKVRRVLDIACGPSLQLREMARRGYETIGLDINSEMLEYLRAKAKEEGLKIETVQADMTNFKLRKKVDYAFIMMGSFNFKSNEALLSHLNSTAASLNKGGLYFIQNFGVNWKIDWTKPKKQSWETEKNGIRVKATYETHVKDVVNQIITEKITLNVNDHGKKQTFTHEEDLKLVFPQELKLLIKLNNKFEFLGWWAGNTDWWHLNQPLEKTEESKLDTNMILLRRK
ncbi:MAG: class I SAM-dependent methyltransferase [Candidatus Bathyarchaeia archaeon]